MTYDLNWLTTKIDNGESIRYLFFWGHTPNKANEEIGKHVFSQWFPSIFTVDGVGYKTAEHWMMAHKAKLFNDDAAFQRIIKAEKPGEVKEIGRQVKNFDPARWDEEKFAIVVQGNIHKFGQNEKLNEFLVSTGDRVIVEASPTDTIWGIGLTADSKLAESPHTWRGSNLLGFALMEARDYLKKIH